MPSVIIETRSAQPDDAPALARIHEDAWRAAYLGILPGLALERQIRRRNAAWWRRALKRTGGALLVLQFDRDLAGYALVGASRAPILPRAGEIFELYLAPEYQGTGLGRRLFHAARDVVAADSQSNLLVWVLRDNHLGRAFYEGLGGRMLGSDRQHYGGESLVKLAYGWSLDGRPRA